MKVLWVTLLLVLALLVVAEAKKKPKPKPKPKGKGKGKPSKPSKCPMDSILANPKLVKKEFGRYTVMKKGKGGKLEPDATAPCWWDLSQNICAKCKPGGEQCGFPMHQFCQPIKPPKGQKKTGCKGIPNYKYTRSSKGYPCYWNTKDLSCAVCMPNRIQCKDDALTQKCGSYCDQATSLKCDGIATTCLNIPKCGYGAKCDKPSGECKCDKGLKGNGFQCFDPQTGEPAVNPAGNVDITIESESQFFVFPDGSSEFPTTAA